MQEFDGEQFDGRHLVICTLSLRVEIVCSIYRSISLGMKQPQLVENLDREAPALAYIN